MLTPVNFLNMEFMLLDRSTTNEKNYRAQFPKKSKVKR